MEKWDEIFESFNKIVKELDELSKYADELYQDFDGNSFTEQPQLISKLDNAFIAATHETGTDLLFIKQYLVNITHYIEFRKKYSNLSLEQLEQIIDHEPNIHLKKELKDKLSDVDVIKLVATIREEWNKTCNNESFEKIKKSFL